MGSVDISITKAFTARAFDIATKDLAEDAQPGEQFYGIQGSNRAGNDLRRRHPAPPRWPGRRGGRSDGGSGEQDQTVAEAAVVAF